MSSFIDTLLVKGHLNNGKCVEPFGVTVMANNCSIACLKGFALTTSECGIISSFFESCHVATEEKCHHVVRVLLGVTGRVFNAEQFSRQTSLHAKAASSLTGFNVQLIETTAQSARARSALFVTTVSFLLNVSELL